MKQFLKPIHLACGNDELRPELQLIKIENGIASATNGMIVVRIDLQKTCDLMPDQISILNGRCIHMETWKEIFKCEELRFDEDGIDVYKSGIKKRLFYAPEQVQLWDDKSIIKNLYNKGTDKIEFVSFNPAFLELCHKIFQHNSLCFSFTGITTGTFVFPYQDSGMMALVMPQMQEDLSCYVVL